MSEKRRLVSSNVDDDEEEDVLMLSLGLAVALLHVVDEEKIGVLKQVVAAAAAISILSYLQLSD